jgi:hypothetical protein
MKILQADFNNWHIQYAPDDGARIAALNYKGHDLLTSHPVIFKPPDRFYGEYETRPVFGYDDCFPTVDSCTYPGSNFDCRDHGELCWQEWHTEVRGRSLICSTDCLQPAVNFKRILTFEGNRLAWRFEATSLSGEKSVFLHVMHALLPLHKISEIEISDCMNIFDEIKSEDSGLKSSADTVKHLLALQPGSFGMVLLKEIAEGFVKLRFTNGLKLEIGFNQKLFPTLGIWWNNGGYPEGGQLRTECAFEPIPGTCSDLSKSFRDGVYLSVEPGKPMVWEITWEVLQNSPFEGGTGDVKRV